MTSTPPYGLRLALTLPLLGLFLIAASARLARLPTLIGQSANLLLLLVAMVLLFVGALVVARRLGREPDAARGSSLTAIVLSWPVLLAVGLLLRLPFLAAPPRLSDDIHRYVWDGRVAAHGVNPYRHAPPDTALVRLRDADWARINNPALPTIYPPTAQRLFELGARWLPGVTGLKCLLLLFDLGVALLLMRLAAGPPRERWRFLVWWWHPLTVLEWSWSGHVDVAGIALLLLAYALAIRHRQWLIVGALVGAATLVKFVAVLAVPFLAGAATRRRDRIALGAGFVLSLAVGYLPYMAPDVNVLGSLGTYAARWRANDFFFGLLVRSGSPLDQPARLTEAKLYAALIAGGIGVLLAILRTPPATAIATWIGSVVLVSPTVHPWYLAWILPFVAIEFSPTWLYATLASLLAYQAVPAWLEGRVWTESIWPKAALTLPFLVVAALELRRRFSRRPGGSGAEV